MRYARTKAAAASENDTNPPSAVTQRRIDVFTPFASTRDQAHLSMRRTIPGVGSGQEGGP